MKRAPPTSPGSPGTAKTDPAFCFDYVHRDLFRSNVLELVERANRLYFQQRQQLDLLIVIECNPKPEHRAFRDTLTGFYGQHLFMTPGTRDCITLFVNSSADTKIADLPQDPSAYGHTSIVGGLRHSLPQVTLGEFHSDNFEGAPVCRLLFGCETRVFDVRLFPNQESHPRCSRSMLKVAGVFKPDGERWARVCDDLAAEPRDD